MLLTWTCIGCNLKYSNFDQFQQHISGIKETVQYYCKNHDIYFNQKSAHSCKSEKRCAFCSEEIPLQYEEHACFHLYKKGDIQSCDVCGMTLRKILLCDHLKQMHKKKLRMCKKCDMFFNSEKEYNQHRYVKHIIREKTYTVCHICGKTYSSFTISGHIKSIHKQSREAKCKECGKAFMNNWKLQRHMIVHSNEMKYQCDICEKMFKMQYSLQVHKNMHFNKDTFCCTICDKQFSTKQSRDKHLRKH